MACWQTLFIELVDSENGSWEYAQVTEHNLMTCEDWEQADKEEALTYI